MLNSQQRFDVLRARGLGKAHFLREQQCKGSLFLVFPEIIASLERTIGSMLYLKVLSDTIYQLCTSRVHLSSLTTRRYTTNPHAPVAHHQR